MNLWHHLAGAAWLPWVVLAVHRLVRRPRPGTAIRLGVCLALQVLAGSADMVLMTAALSLAWVVGVARPATRPAPIAAAGAGAILLALLLSAGQWLPAVDVASHAIRRELPTELADRWSVPPAGLVRAVLPLDGSGRLVWTPQTHLRLFDTTAEPLLGSLYLGIVPLALAGAGLAGSRRRALTWALAAAAVAATLAAFGSHAPFAALVRAVVPGASHLRYPSKAMLIPAFACALLAGQGLAAARRIARARTAAGVVALCGAAALAAGAVILGPGLPWAFAWNLLADRPGVRADALPWAVRFTVLALLALLASAVLLRRARRPPIARWAALLLLCTAGELWLAHNDLHPTAPPELLKLSDRRCSRRSTRRAAAARTSTTTLSSKERRCGGSGVTRPMRSSSLRLASTRACGRPSPCASIQCRRWPRHGASRAATTSTSRACSRCRSGA